MKKRALILAAALAAAVGCVFLALKTGVGLPCPVRLLTGFYCPGCGVSRMVLSLIKLDFYGAFRYNPLVFILSPIILLCAAEAAFCYVTGREGKLLKKIPKPVLWAVIIILVAFGVLRNIPCFSFLAPTAV